MRLVAVWPRPHPAWDGIRARLVLLALVGGWIVAGLTFVWWFDRYLARAAHARGGAPKQLKKRR